MDVEELEGFPEVYRVFLYQKGISGMEFQNLVICSGGVKGLVNLAEKFSNALPGLSGGNSGVKLVNPKTPHGLVYSLLERGIEPYVSFKGATIPFDTVQHSLKKTL